MYYFPLNYKLSTGVSSVQVQEKQKLEAQTIHISNQGQHTTRCPLKTFWSIFFLYMFFFCKQCKNLYMLNTPIYGVLNIFCNPLLHNIFQVKCLTVHE